ncbi:MAG TPA: FAD-dependent thymidylate synthase [Anaerovoracaceae bacterium]|nr:FAD-dependent thymidylate synthase [Anaerovoracaceae bacterium]
MFSANVICDSISPDNIRLTTLEITYPRIIHAEFMTHRVFSRNSASSRAIPIEKIIQRVTDDPFIPEYWGKNQKGMKADYELSPAERDKAALAWLIARDAAVFSATALKEIGVHKQLANRILEPYMYHTVLVTSTEWSNWDGLRRHKDAQPEIKKIADLMYQAREDSIPFALDYGQWHMPLVNDLLILKDNGFTDAQIREISVGRCCRISYLTHHGVRDPQADIDLCRQLRADGHMSPFEHVARPVTSLEKHLLYHGEPAPFIGNFKGWVQYRKELPHEADYSKIMNQDPTEDMTTEYLNDR